MGAVKGERRKELKQQAFAFGKEISPARNAFTRKRRNYLTAVINGDFKSAEAIENALIQRLGGHPNPRLRDALQDNKSRQKFVELLRNGVPLSNALKISLLSLERRQITDPFIKGKPKYRRPEVLRLEKEALEFEYESLRLSLKNAEKLGLKGIQENLKEEITAIAKQIHEYSRLMEKRLVE